MTKIFSNIHQKKVGEKVVEKVSEKVSIVANDRLNINQIKILDLVKKNPLITAKILSAKIRISLRKIEENLRKLKEINKLKIS